MGRKKDRMSIIFRSDQMLCAREALSDAELGRLYEALRAYSIDGELPPLGEEREAWRVLFSMMRAAQDDAIRKYDETCERNKRIAEKRSSRVVPVVTSGTNIIEDSRIEDKRIEDKRIKESRIAASALVGPEGGTGIDGVRWL